MDDHRQENLNIEIMTPTFHNFGSMKLPGPVHKQVRFNHDKTIDDDSCPQLIDLQDSLRDRLKPTPSLLLTDRRRRVRSASLSDEYCTPAPENLAHRDSTSLLYEIVSLNGEGGTLKGCYLSGRDTCFDVDYTTFCGLKLTGDIMRDIFRVGDTLYVEQRSPYVKVCNGRGRREWRALDVRSPNAYSPENGTHNFSDDDEHIVWITYGRIKLISKRKRSYMIIATNVREQPKISLLPNFSSKDSFTPAFSGEPEQIIDSLKRSARKSTFGPIG
uniref:Uncharacterized protein n=1 Tax=Romanomermis culicivorax TaxID=13658 RepID=A0A915L0U9_ROMCU